MARLHALIYFDETLEEVILDYPRPSGALESLLRSWRDADAVVVWGKRAWTLATALLNAARRIGFNHYSIDVVDDIEGVLAGLDIGVIVKLRIERLLTGNAYRAKFKIASSKNVSRRAFLKNPLATLLSYTSAPLIDGSVCSSLPHCALCIESCPASALEGKPPQVDPGSCVECMECVYSCPAWAIYPPGNSRAGLTAYIEGLRREGFNGVIVVTEYRYLTDLYAIARKNSGALAVLPVHSLLHLHPRTALEAFVRGIPLVAYDPGHSSPAWLLEAEAYGIAWRAPSLDRLLEASRKASSSAHVSTPLDSLYPFAGSIGINHDECTLCGACAKACPTGAMRLREPPEFFELIFDSNRCIGCMECLAVCPVDAVTARWLTHPLRRSRERVAWSEPHRCPACGAVVGPRKQVEAVARKLRKAGLPDEAVKRVFLCPACRATKLDYVP